MSEQPPAPPDHADALRATERWFVQHGLPYFVPEEREAARSALHSRRTLLMLVLTVLVALAAGVLLARLFEDVAAAPDHADGHRGPDRGGLRSHGAPGAADRHLGGHPHARAACRSCCRWPPERCRCC